MSSRKTDKELAFLHDLFIATDWGERFSELIDEHIEFRKRAKVLYLGSGTGGHALSLHERYGEALDLVCVDENEECNDLARAKATATQEQIQFKQSPLERLPFADGQFEFVIGDVSLISPNRLREVLIEMSRVATAGATVALTLPTASSFGEFFSIYWEALHNTGLTGLESSVEHLITESPTIGDAERMAEEENLEDVKSWTRIEEFDYESGEQFLNSPLIEDFLMPGWLAGVPETSMVEVMREITRLINEERHESEFALSVKATLIVGRKGQSH